MNYLFVHQNCPGQYLHLVRHLAAEGKHRIIFITQRKNVSISGVEVKVYQPHRKAHPEIHRYLHPTEAALLNAQGVARVALELKQSGFVPDVMLGHNGWGEIWYLKDVFPNTPLIGYFEFFYRAEGADVGFDPAYPSTLDTKLRVRTKNIGNLLGLEAADLGQCPTRWQQSTYPGQYQSKLKVLHEGIDTDLVRPDPQAVLQLESGLEFRAGQEIVTYVARNLEPYRGFPSFMQSLPTMLKERPHAQVLIVGGDEVSYGSQLPLGRTYRQQLLEELGEAIDPNRVHFLGKVPYATFLKVLQVSRVHVYLTYPFVLSWSMLEAMAAGCLIMGSKTAPVEEVIRDGENGYLVDFFAPEAVAERVIEALENPLFGSEQRAAARQTVVEDYALRRKCLPEYLEWINEQSKPLRRKFNSIPYES